MTLPGQSITVAGRDTGGRTYPAGALPLVRASWSWPPGERGALATAECSLELARDDLARSLADFEGTGTRPGWVKQTRRLVAAVEKLRAAVEAELDTA